MKTYTLTVNEQELGYISRILGAQPFTEVAGLISKLQTQIATPKPDPEPEKTD